jgi:CHAT domain-containing protein
MRRSAKELLRYLLLACVTVFATAHGQSPYDYVEESVGVLGQQEAPFATRLSPSQRLQLADSVAQSARQAFARYPEQLARALAWLEPQYVNAGQKGRAEGVLHEALGLISTVGDRDPDAYVDVNWLYADYLLVISPSPENRRLARNALDAAAREATSKWPATSPHRQMMLRLFARDYQWLGDRVTAQRLLVIAGTQNLKQIAWTYAQEERELYADKFVDFSNGTLRAPNEDWEKVLHGIDEFLDTAFKYYPYERSEGHLELASVLLEAQKKTAFASELSAGRQVFESTDGAFPDIRITLEVLEADQLAWNREFHDAYQKCGQAIALAKELFPNQSAFVGPLLIAEAKLLLRGDYVEESIDLANRIVADYDSAPNGAETEIQGLIIVAAARAEQLQVDLADTELREAINAATALPNGSGITSPLGAPPLTPEEDDALARRTLTGRYHKALLISELYRFASENDLSSYSADRWRADAEASLNAVGVTFGEDSDIYLQLLDYFGMVGKDQLGSKYVEDIGRKYLASLQARHISDWRLARANYILEKSQLTASQENYAYIRSQISRSGVDPEERAAWRIMLARAYIRGNRISDATAIIDSLKRWRDKKISASSSASELLETDHVGDVGVLQGLMDSQLELADHVSERDGRRNRFLQDAFYTAQILGRNQTTLLGRLRPRDPSRARQFYKLIHDYEFSSALGSHAERALADAIADDPGDVNAESVQLAKTQSFKDVLAKKIRSQSANFDSVVAFAGPSVDAIMRSLRPDDVLLVFVVGGPSSGDEDRLRGGVTFIIDRERGLRYIPLCSASDLCRGGRLFGAANSYITYVTPDAGRGKARPVGDFVGMKDGPTIGLKLYRAIWAPIDAQISRSNRKIEHVMIVADQYLVAFPFAALVTRMDKRTPHWLVEKPYAISYLESADTLTGARRDRFRAHYRLTAFGDPVDASNTRLLPKSAAEACALAVLVAKATPQLKGVLIQSQGMALSKRCAELVANSKGLVQVFLRGRATGEQLFKLSEADKLSSLDILSFSTHGYMGGSAAQEPGIVLSSTKTDPDGFLSITEIAALKLRVNLVILSACSTADSNGLGIRIREVPSVSEMFMQAGARSVLATFTTVTDPAAIAVTTKTIQVANGEPKRGIARSLQEAMRAQIHDGKAPSFWAPFAYFGVD